MCRWSCAFPVAIHPSRLSGRRRSSVAVGCRSVCLQCPETFFAHFFARAFHMSQTSITSNLSFAAPAVIADDAFADLPQLPSIEIPPRIAAALDAMREGRPVVLQDDDDREDEADLIVAAEKLTDATMALLIRECSGIVCLCLPDDKVRALRLPPMSAANGSRYGTASTVPVSTTRPDARAARASAEDLRASRAPGRRSKAQSVCQSGLLILATPEARSQAGQRSPLQPQEPTRYRGGRGWPGQAGHDDVG